MRKSRSRHEGTACYKFLQLQRPKSRDEHFNRNAQSRYESFGQQMQRQYSNTRHQLYTRPGRPSFAQPHCFAKDVPEIAEWRTTVRLDLQVSVNLEHLLRNSGVPCTVSTQRKGSRKLSWRKRLCNSSDRKNSALSARSAHAQGYSRGCYDVLKRTRLVSSK